MNIVLRVFLIVSFVFPLALKADEFFSADWYMKLKTDKELLSLDRDQWSGIAGSIDDEFVYTVNTYGYFVKVSKTDGKVAARKKLKKGSISSMLLHDEGVILSTYDGFLKLLDPKSLKVIWSYNIGSPVANQMISDDANIYFTTLKGAVFCVSISQKKEIWRFSSEANPELSFLGSGDFLIWKKHLFVPLNNGGLVALDLKNGIEKARFSPEKKERLNDSDAAPVVFNDTIYYPLSEGLAALTPNLKLKEILFKNLKSGFSIIPHKDFFFISTLSGSLYKVDLEKKKVLWKKVLEQDLVSQIYPVKSDSPLEIGFAAGRKSIYAINLFTSEILDHFPVHYGVSHNMLQFADEPYALYFLSNKSGLFKIRYGRK